MNSEDKFRSNDKTFCSQVLRILPNQPNIFLITAFRYQHRKLIAPQPLLKECHMAAFHEPRSRPRRNLHDVGLEVTRDRA